MNQWVATKKWLLFMNLGPVVFVSNREVKRLATMFYSRSTNSQLRVGVGSWRLKGFTLFGHFPTIEIPDLQIYQV
jgi:hypothetical protein